MWNKGEVEEEFLRKVNKSSIPSHGGEKKIRCLDHPGWWEREKSLRKKTLHFGDREDEDLLNSSMLCAVSVGAEPSGMHWRTMGSYSMCGGLSSKPVDWEAEKEKRVIPVKVNLGWRKGFFKMNGH